MSRRFITPLLGLTLLLPAVLGAAVAPAEGQQGFYVANEGRFVAFVASGDAERALSLLRSHRLGEWAARIGEVGGEGADVVMTGPLGTARVIDLPSGEQLPRIC